MIRQLLEEVKAAPLDEASRNRLRDIHQASIKELEAGLAPELVEELERLSLPFTEEATPSEGELRIAQAQPMTMPDEQVQNQVQAGNLVPMQPPAAQGAPNAQYAAS